VLLKNRIIFLLQRVLLQNFELNLHKIYSMELKNFIALAGLLLFVLVFLYLIIYIARKLKQGREHLKSKKNKTNDSQL
jgi:flagellar biogenesis protein FliO